MSDLRDKVSAMASALGDIDDERVWQGMTCWEIETLVAVMEEVGEGSRAEEIADLHARGDEDGDLHYQGHSERAHRVSRSSDGRMRCDECGTTYGHPLDTNETCPSSPLHPDNEESE